MDKLYGLIQDINPKEICNHIENGNLAEWCNAWRIAAKEALQPKTNADRVRAMSDEELAGELMTWRIETEAKHQGVESNYPNTQKAILEWLKQPAE